MIAAYELLAAPPPAAAADLCRDFGIVGINHRNCEIRALGEFIRNAGDPAAMSRKLLAYGLREIFILSTCNRYEVFFVHSGSARAGEFVNLIFGTPPPSYLALDGARAVSHLYEVAASLDSLVIGEGQILGQLRAALARAENAATLGPRLRYLVSEAFGAARRVRRETNLHQGASIVSLATGRLRRAAEEEQFTVPIALVGAGEMTEQAAAALSKRRNVALLFVNRTEEKARALAERFGGRPMALRAFLTNPPAICALLTSTSAPFPIFNKEAVSCILQNRPKTTAAPFLMIDLSVGGDVDPAARAVAEIDILTIDGLREEAAARAKLQQNETRSAREIVALGLRRLAERELRRADGIAFGLARGRGEAAARREVEKLALPEASERRLRSASIESAHRVAHAKFAGSGSDSVFHSEQAALHGVFVACVRVGDGGRWARETLAAITNAVERGPWESHFL